MANQIEHKTEIVLQGDQFVRRITQEIAIGTQERFIKQLIDQHSSEILWSPRPVFQGEDIDNTGMVKNIWTGTIKGRSTTHVITELNYFPLCGACLVPDNDNYRLFLRDMRRFHEDADLEWRYTQRQIDEGVYFDAKPLRIPIMPAHNARVFLHFSLGDYATTPSIFMIRSGLPYVTKGLPNVFPEDGVLCAGDDWVNDTSVSRSAGYSLTKHIKKALTAFSSTPPNYDLSDDNEHALWGTWSKDGVLLPCGAPIRGRPHTKTQVCDFVKHLNNNPYA